MIDRLLLQPLERDGRLALLDGDHVVAEGIELHPAPGHTPGHQIVRIRSRGARAIITGDTFNHPDPAPAPRLAVGHRRRAGAGRGHAARRARGGAVPPGHDVAPTHLAEPFGAQSRSGVRRAGRLACRV